MSAILVGNLVADVDLRWTPSGAPVASFTIASTPRTFDKQAGQWVDGESLFMRCTVWRTVAENVAESLTKGTRVIVSGELVQRSWEKDGVKRTSVEMQVEEVGPSLKFASAKVARKPAGQAPGQPDAWGGEAGGPPF